MLEMTMEEKGQKTGRDLARKATIYQFTVSAWALLPGSEGWFTCGSRDEKRGPPKGGLGASTGW